LENVEQAKETVTFKLDGKDVTVPAGWTVMQAAKREKVDIPHFCWHPGLTVAGVCRFCMVKVEGRPKLEIACNLRADNGMQVSTKTDDVKDAHKWALEFHLVNHPLDCPICDQAGECGLQDYYMSVGKYQSQMSRPKVLKPKALDVGGDLVLDTERCILCSRCTRFEEEVTKTGALGIFDRGDRSIIGIFPGKKIHHNYTANLVDICPVGAFTSKDFRFKQRVWFLKDKPSVCPGCSTGCKVNVYGKEETRRYFRIKPRESETEGNWMCDKGRHTYEHLNKEKRQIFAQAAVEGKMQRQPVDELIGSVAAKLEACKADEVAVLLSAQYTNEEYAALLGCLVGERGIKNIFQWREPTENAEAFDGVLWRGDENANTNGLLQALMKQGLPGQRQNQFDQLAAKPFKLILAFAPEVPGTFPSLEGQLQSLAELENVTLFTVASAPKQLKFSAIIPTKGFAEKVGTFTNHAGETGELADPFPAAVADARDLQQIVQAWTKKKD